MKRHGYILFSYYDISKPDKGVRLAYEDFIETKIELDNRHRNDLDDKWDYNLRHKIHYFYLDLAEMKYYPLEKWKTSYTKKWCIECRKWEDNNPKDFCMSRIMFEDK